MKILFSEYKSDYSNYIFPYAIWAIPEKNESPSEIFSKGFLPSSKQLDKYYLCRQIRVDLRKFKPSSENRRIFKKGKGISFKLIPRNQFDFTKKRREFYKNYADIKFGKDVMTYDRLDSLFHSKIISHLLLFIDDDKNKEVGVATLFIQNPQLIYYYYAFYDLNYYPRNLGMYMMTSAVEHFSIEKYDYIYLGSCYSRNALYKTQFLGAEFFNGFCWSNNLKELKYLLQRDKTVITRHLLETDEFIEKYYDGDFAEIVNLNF